MHRMRNTIQPYAWGSRTAIAEIQRRPATGAPEAEMWMGAHPAAPSRLMSEHGESTLEQLPYLMKLLAATEPLSLQVHPNMEQAREGFAREERLGVERCDAKRSYKDASHKPELLAALTEFEAFCGFRPVEEAASVLRGVGVASLSRIASQLHTADDLRRVLPTLLAERDPRPLIAEVVAACERRVSSGTQHAAEYARLVSIAQKYPADTGVIVTLLLNHLHLQPGEAVFLPAGVVHSYLSGVGVEIMANSDNVLRAGLTPKHIDVPELLSITRWEDGVMHPIPSTRISVGKGVDVLQWQPPVEEFCLTRAVLGAGAETELVGSGPRIAVVTSGVATLSDNHSSHAVSAGESVYVPHDAGVLGLSADEECVVFLAAPGCYGK